MNLNKTGKFFNLPNKFWEIQLANWGSEAPEYLLLTKYTTRCDHAGFSFNVGIHTLMFSFKVYDNRHWDEEGRKFEGE